MLVVVPLTALSLPHPLQGSCLFFFSTVSHRLQLHPSLLVTSLSLHSSGLFTSVFLACQVSLVPPHCSRSDRLLCRLVMCWYEREQIHTHLLTHWFFCSLCPRHDVQPVIRSGSALRNSSARRQSHDTEHSTILNTPPSS